MKTPLQYMLLIVFLQALHINASQPEEITFRAANQKDLVAIAALTRTFFYDDLKPIILTGYADNPIVQAGHVDAVLEDWISKRNEYAEKVCQGNKEMDEKMIIAEGNNNAENILGFCSFEKKPTSIGDIVYVSFLGVNKQHRRHGIGTLLLSKTMTTFDNVNLCELTTLAQANRPVQEFYEKRGFINKGLVTIDPRVTDTHYLYQLQLKE